MKFSNKSLSFIISLIIISSPIIPLNSIVFAASSTTPVVDTTAPKGTVTKLMVTFNGNSTKSKGFTWYTSRLSVKSDLQVVEKTSNASNFDKCDKFIGTSAVPSNNTAANPPAGTTTAKLEFLHKAEATGLKPNTTYYYRVGDASLGLWSTVGTFQTASTNGAFSFIDLADPQAKDMDEATLAASTFKTALATVPDSKFISVNGDLVDDGSVEYEWDWLFNNIGQPFRNTTIAPIAGNHENKSSSFVDHFNLTPATGSDTTTGVYYSYDYSNAHFIMLNNNENTSVNDLSQAQIDWMKADVAKARANGSKWIIVNMHKGPYSTSNHATDSDINGPAGSRNTVAPVMAKLGIDLVLQGHDHVYARSKPIKADNTAATEDLITESFNGKEIKYQVNPNGTTYLIPATAGPKVYYKNTKTTLLPLNYYALFDVADESHAAIYGADPTDATRPARGNIQNFESVTINNDKLSVISYEIDQNKKDITGVAQPYIIDTFGIVKPVKPVKPSTPVVVYKNQYGITTSSNVSIRTGAGTDYSVQGSLSNGTKVNILGTAGSFYKISYSGKTGFISNQYVKITAKPVTIVTPKTIYKNQYGVATGDGISIRTGAGPQYSWQGSFKLGTKINILGTAGSFYKVSYNGITGYVSNQYVKITAKPVAVVTPKTIYKNQFGIATGDGISIRTGAGPQYSWQGSFKLGTKINILGTAGSFYKVSYNGITGYVSNQYVKITVK